jgi:hypothetical protein
MHACPCKSYLEPPALANQSANGCLPQYKRTAADFSLQCIFLSLAMQRQMQAAYGPARGRAAAHSTLGAGRQQAAWPHATSAPTTGKMGAGRCYSRRIAVVCSCQGLLCPRLCHRSCSLSNTVVDGLYVLMPCSVILAIPFVCSRPALQPLSMTWPGCCSHTCFACGEGGSVVKCSMGQCSRHYHWVSTGAFAPPATTTTCS